MLVWPDGAVGGTTAGVCQRYPRDGWASGWKARVHERRDRRARPLPRLVRGAACTHGLVANGNTAPLIGLPGTAVTQTVILHNMGIEADQVTFTKEGGPWPLDLTLQDGGQIIVTEVYTISPCTAVTLTASIAIPTDAPRDITSRYDLHFNSLGGTAASAALSVAAKTPAPVLLVDDERWYRYEDRYTASLDALDIGYDMLDTKGAALAHAADILPRYPLVIWWTGYDWYQPLAAADETNLAAYLDAGGRLLLSSQDLMDINGGNPFIKERLGIVAASYSITATEVTGVSGGPLQAGLGPWQLDYPFRNWSDGLILDAAARATVHDEHLYTVGAARPATRGEQSSTRSRWKRWTPMPGASCLVAACSG